ncbi:MAG: hypothetical protein H0X40_18805 [Chthoniobacterales bacterium]|nr:hypothetical protein [Chthoniobacterales bacterium]
MFGINRCLLGAVAMLALLVVATKKSDRERAELHGPVKSVSVRWQANHKDDYGSVEERELGTTTYDESGALLVDRQITPDFVRERVPERRNGNETVFRSKMGNATERYEFDSHDNMTCRRLWYSDTAIAGPAILERMKYDATGRMSERESFGPDGKRFNLTRFTRDPYGDVVIEEDRSDNLKPPYPRMHYTYTRDAYGNWTSRIVQRESVPETSYEYRYAGNLFRAFVYFADPNAKHTP